MGLSLLQYINDEGNFLEKSYFPNPSNNITSRLIAIVNTFRNQEKVVSISSSVTYLIIVKYITTNRCMLSIINIR